MKIFILLVSLWLAISFVACDTKPSFNDLLERDPVAALEQAKKEDVGLIPTAAKAVVLMHLNRGDVAEAKAIANERSVELGGIIWEQIQKSGNNIQRQKMLIENFGDELTLEAKAESVNAYYGVMMKKLEYYKAARWAEKYQMGQEKFDAAVTGLVTYENENSSKFICLAAENIVTDNDRRNKLATACCNKAMEDDGLMDPENVVRPCLDLISSQNMIEFLAEAKKLAGVYGIYLIKKNTAIDYLRAGTVMLRFDVDFERVERAFAAAGATYDPARFYMLDMFIRR